jgi:hypothetical protein
VTSHAHDRAGLDLTLEALSERAPGAVRRARAALEVCLGGVQRSRWPEVAWAFSALTGDGFPVEISFSSLSATAVRYATEVAGPEEPESQRIRRAFQTYKQLTGWNGSAEIENAVAQMQCTRRLGYGAWFGATHTAEADRYKIYAEIPCIDGLKAIVPNLFGEGVPLSHCRSRPVMFGFQPDSGVRELYFAAQPLAEADLGRLLWGCGLGHCYRETLELILEASGRPCLPPAITGFSIAWSTDHNVSAVSFYAPARVLFGSDYNIRRTLLTLARNRNWDFTMYERATEVIWNRDSPLPHHGIIAWLASPDAPVELRIVLRPPEHPD